jgi:hypothetical protein
VIFHTLAATAFAAGSSPDDFSPELDQPLATAKKNPQKLQERLGFTSRMTSKKHEAKPAATPVAKLTPQVCDSSATLLQVSHNVRSKVQSRREDVRLFRKKRPVNSCSNSCTS